MRTFKTFMTEQDNRKLKSVMDKFIPFVKSELNVDSLPKVHTVTGKDAQDKKAFGWWDGEKVTICPDGRHPMDVMRTLAHEFVHATHGHTNGEDGSDHENEANAKAGVIMRRFARANPELF